MAHDVFISYSTHDKTTADALCAALEAARIRCWIAPRDVLAGRGYGGEITRAIERSRVLVLIFSEHSNVSEHVHSEVELAANARVHILNFRVDTSPLGEDLRFFMQHRHWLDALTPPLEEHFRRLTEAIQKLLVATQPPFIAAKRASDPVVEEAKAQPTSPLEADGEEVAASFSRSIGIWRRSNYFWALPAALGIILLISLVLTIRHTGHVAATEPAKSAGSSPTSSPVQLDTDAVRRYVTQALNLSKKVQGVNRFRLWSALSATQSRAGDRAGARETIAKAIAAKDDRDFDRITFTEVRYLIFFAQAEAGDFDAAIATARDFGSSTFKDEATRQIIDAQVRAGDFQQALATARSLGDRTVKAKVEIASATAQVKSRDLPGARLTLSRAIDDVLGVHDDYTRSVLLQQIAAAQVAAGDLAGATTTANSIRDSFPKALALRGIADAGGAAEWRGINPVADTFIKVRELKEGALAKARNGDLEGAQRGFATALAAVAEIHDKVYSRVATQEIVAAEAEAGDLSGAKATASSLTDEQTRIQTFGAIAGICARLHGFAAAEKWVIENVTDTATAGYCYVVLANRILDPARPISF